MNQENTTHEAMAQQRCAVGVRLAVGLGTLVAVAAIATLSRLQMI